ncbi:MAG: sugar transporter, partial [Alphaproteobacteria bacterium]
LIQLRVLAFDPDDAFRIAQAIVEESTQMINRLNERSREDALRYARADLDAAAERLKKARQALTEFRAREQIVDPNADIQSQVGLLGSLQQQLANALIEYDLLRTNTREGDPRLRQLEQRIEVIRKRIEEERRKFGSGEEAAPAAPAGAGGRDYAKVVSEYEGLLVEREFAEKAYLSALSAYESARSAAQRQTRYLATFIGPTRPETAEYPQRWLITALIGGFAFLTWVIVVLVGYSIRDRR